MTAAARSGALACALFALIMSPAYAQQKTVPFSQTQAGMNETELRAFEKADRTLNVLYKQLLAQQDKQGKLLLRDAQRAWLKFRDAQAAFDADEVRGGSMQPMAYSGSLRQTTEARSRELRALLARRH